MGTTSYLATYDKFTKFELESPYGTSSTTKLRVKHKKPSLCDVPIDLCLTLPVDSSHRAGKLDFPKEEFPPFNSSLARPSTR